MRGLPATARRWRRGSDAERAALLEQADQAPIRYDPVLVALSKAEAARQLLVEAGGVFGGESLEWIEGFAEQACFEALEDAKVAYVKAVAAGTAASPTATKDVEPAAEATR